MPTVKYSLREGRNLKTADPMFYAQISPVTPVKIYEIADEITGYCSLTQPDIMACLTALQESIIEHLQAGDSVAFFNLMTMSPTVKSKAVSRAAEFTNECLKRIGVRTTMDSTIKYQLLASNPQLKFQREKVSE